MGEYGHQYSITDFVPGTANSFSTCKYSLSFGRWGIISRSSTDEVIATNGSTVRRIGRDRVHVDAFSVGGKAVPFINNGSLLADSLVLYDFASNSTTFLATLPDVSVRIAYPGDRPSNTAVSGNLFAIGFNSQVVVSDGTAQGTFVTTATGGELFQGAGQFTFFDGKLYFTATTTSKGNEIHVLDLQTQLATPAVDIRPGTSGSLPESLTAYYDTLFFIANGDSQGYELHKLKGSFVSRVSDIGPGNAGIQGASLDTAFGSLIVGCNRLNRDTWLYRRGRLSASAHDLYSITPIGLNGDLRRATTILKVPELSRRFAVFAGPALGSDSVMEILSTGCLKYYAPTVHFQLSGTAMEAYVVADSNLYFSSGSGNYLYRLEELPTSIVSKSEMQRQDLFYPNPFQNRVLHNRGERALTDISIFDVQGRCRLQGSALAGGQTLALKDFTPGFYIVQVWQGQGG